MLSKFVGQSEENIRALFAEARAEQVHRYLCVRACVRACFFFSVCARVWARVLPAFLNIRCASTLTGRRFFFRCAHGVQEEKGDDSSLHVVIFDEIDALCKQRGTTSGDAGMEK